MTVQSLPSAAKSGLIDALQWTGVRPTHLIHIAGPGALPAMLWLCRRGFERVQHVSLHSPNFGLEPAQALLIPHVSRLKDLPPLLGSAPRPCEGGVLIARTGVQGMPPSVVAALIEPFGYELEHHLQGWGHALYLARRPAAALKVA